VYPRLFELVKQFTIHGPCGEQNLKSPCIHTTFILSLQINTEKTCNIDANTKEAEKLNELKN
jgi:hypothetical protein